MCKNDTDGTIRHCARLGLVPPETYTGERGIEIKKNRDLFLGNESLYDLFATVKRKVVGDNKGNLCLIVQ